LSGCHGEKNKYQPMILAVHRAMTLKPAMTFMAALIRTSGLEGCDGCCINGGRLDQFFAAADAGIDYSF